MSNIYYFGDNDTVHGPVTELEVQRWYLNGYFSSNAKFQITSSIKFEPKERIYTLGELIDLNGRTVPFYLSSEKVDREKNLEEKLTQLTQEMESLRNNDQRMQRSQKDAISALQTQVTELVQSNKNLQKQVDPLSNKRETSPVTDQLEKKVNELKKQVDEQEKKVDSMKKEISAVNSKCGRNDSKLEKLLERQDSTEGNMIGFDKVIADLKESEKSIRESLSTCEQNTDSNTSQLQTITRDLSAIKEEMASQREEFSTDRAELRSSLEEVQELANRLLNEPERSENSASAETESDIPPWESKDKKAVIEAKSKDQEQLPWAKAVVKEKETVPWEENREEPPLSTSGCSMISGKKDTVVEAEKARNGLSIDQTQVKAENVPASSKKAATGEKPMPRVKDWEAICRDLSDDEVDEKPADLITSIDLDTWSAVFVRDFVELLRVYCAALDSDDYASLKQRSGAFDYLTMRGFCAACDRQAAHFVRVRKEIVTEVRRLAATTIYCSACRFTTTSPRHLFYHFTDTDHVTRKLEDLPLLNDAYGMISGVISTIFFHFISSSDEIEVAIKGEHELAIRGRNAVWERPRPLADYRPTTEFMIKAVARVAELKPCHVNAYDLPTESINPVDMGKRKKEVAEMMRNYFSCAKRKATFKKEFEKHVAEGVLACGACAMLFDNVDEYYKHTATYDHAVYDQSIFGMCMSIWKGHEYWDAMMEEQQ